ncbi:MAG: YcgN family cysteine cluster protein [Alphaproteobacteria bacterium]
MSNDSKTGSDERPFWETTPLIEMTPDQWESLCDGCGKCCLIKLEDEASDKLVFTNVACKELDCASCQCKSYSIRKQVVPDCLVLTVDNLPAYSDWLPYSCAYKRLFEQESLPEWHPLITGSTDAMHQGGFSAANRVVSEDFVADSDLEDHVVDWAGE